MSQKVAVIVKDGQNVVSNNVVMEGGGAAGKPLIVKAGSKQRIELKDLDTHVAPDQVRVTKDGKNLKIKIGKKAAPEDDAADIIIEEYFDNNASLIGVAENGEYYNFIPQGANYDSYYSLGGEVIGEETATDWMPLVLGLLGAGALAALAGGGGGGGGDHTAPDSLTVALNDDEAPIIGAISAGTVTNDATPVISGVTEANATVTAYDDAGNTLGSATANDSGNYTIVWNANTELADGDHYIKVTAADAAGNSTTASSVVFTVDTTAPTAPVLDDTDGSIVAGTAEPGSTVTITDGNGNPIGTTTANQNGDFSYKPSTPIADTTVINATATDAAGNVSAPGTTTVDAAITVAPNIYDDIAPVIGQVFSGDTTNDTQPEISGAAGSVPANVTVTIYDDGTKIGETTSNSDGSWSFTPTTPFTDGSSHSITYTKNGGSNHSPAVDFTVDTTAPSSISIALTDDVAPVTGPITEGNTTNDTKPAISGVTEAGATVTIKDGSTVLGTVVADGSGNYSFTPIAPLNEGAHSISATATDAAGNTITSTTTNFTVDSIAPTIEMTITDDVGTSQGPIANGAIIDDTKPTISGTTEAGATVTIKDDAGNTLGSATADTNGNYTITPTTALSEGQHYIVVTATDTAGNSTTASSVVFTVDTTAPTAPVLDDTDGSIVVGTAEPGSTITITDGNGNPIGTTTANQNGNFSYTPTTLIPDATVINATATDAAGNESQPGTVTVDATIQDAPIVYDDIAPVVGQVLNGDTTNDGQPTFSGLAGSVPGNVTVTIYDSGTAIGTTTSNPDGSWSFTPTTAFADGSSHSITYTKNGGTNHSPAVNFTIDTTVPAITMILADDVAPITGTIANGSVTNDTRPTISGVTEANATVTIKDGSTVLGTVTADASGNYTFTPIAPLNEGSHAISATATDAAGNTVTSTTTNFTVDSIAPTVEMTITDDVGATQGAISNGAIIDDTTPTISGHTEAGATVTIKDGAIVLGVVTADSNGNYTFTPDEPLSMDEHTITATATDASGNTTASVPTTFTIAPPEVIDLGDHGQLINPVFVDGNYYYYWDRDKDGEGIVNGNPDFDDTFTHNELDAIFMYDANGNLRPDNLSDTNDTYRYAELEGYQVALPTYGGDKSNDGTQTPTAIDNVPPGEINPTYDDLVAIWDAFESKPDLPNGRTAENGTPPEWANGIYWSATPYETTQHYAMDMTNGHGGTNAETNQSWTAVQVIF